MTDSFCESILIFDSCPDAMLHQNLYNEAYSFTFNSALKYFVAASYGECHKLVVLLGLCSF